MAHVPGSADAVALGGGDFRAIGAIEALETKLNRPVLSSNQASFWCALRYSKVDEHVNGYGRLFAMELSDSRNSHE